MNQRIEWTSPEAAGPAATNRTHTRFQLYLIEKLQRMRRNRQEYAFRPDAEEWLLKGMDRAIYSVYLDCLEQGLAREAGSILSGGEGELPPPPVRA